MAIGAPPCDRLYTYTLAYSPPAQSQRVISKSRLRKTTDAGLAESDKTVTAKLTTPFRAKNDGSGEMSAEKKSPEQVKQKGKRKQQVDKRKDNSNVDSQMEEREGKP